MADVDAGPSIDKSVSVIGDGSAVSRVSCVDIGARLDSRVDESFT